MPLTDVRWTIPLTLMNSRSWWSLTIIAPASPPAAPAQAERKITATLYYVTDDGASLTGVQREVPFGEPAPDQARRIVEAQIAAPEPPLVSAIPPGTTLRSLYITDKGDAFVDLSAEVRTRHTGGSQDELLTVYTIVNVLTVNLPAIQRVQILVDGKEADTLAGHVDLFPRETGGDPHLRPEQVSGSVPPLEVQQARSCRRLDTDRVGSTRPRENGAQAPQAVAGQLGGAAVRIQELHPRAVAGQPVHDEAVGADAAVTIA